MDKFVENTGHGGQLRRQAGIVMDYYDGNTVTALWNYAQHYAMSDAHFGTMFGPSTPGALNLISGNTHGVQHRRRSRTRTGTMITQLRSPLLDDCSAGKRRRPGDVQRQEHRRPDERRRRHLGLVPGRLQADALRPTATRSAAARTPTPPARDVTDYLPHHEPFQYYASTANPHHLPPTSVAAIGHDRPGQPPVRPDRLRRRAGRGQPAAGLLPEGGRAEDAHPGYSGPLDEQRFVVARSTRSSARRSGTRPRSSSPTTTPTAGTTTSRPDRAGLATAAATRSTAPAPAARRPAPATTADRCGPGPRLPLLVVSPYAQAELRRPHADRAGVDPAVHRGQLEPRPDRRPVLRRARRAAERHVRLRPGGRGHRRCSSTRRPASLGASRPMAIAPPRPDPGPRPTVTPTPTATATADARPPTPSRRSRSRSSRSS